jgi:hypothetical protein
VGEHSNSIHNNKVPIEPSPSNFNSTYSPCLWRPQTVPARARVPHQLHGAEGLSRSGGGEELRFALLCRDPEETLLADAWNGRPQHLMNVFSQDELHFVAGITRQIA